MWKYFCSFAGICSTCSKQLFKADLNILFNLSTKKKWQRKSRNKSTTDLNIHIKTQIHFVQVVESVQMHILEGIQYEAWGKDRTKHKLLYNSQMNVIFSKMILWKMCNCGRWNKVFCFLESSLRLSPLHCSMNRDVKKIKMLPMTCH